MTRLPLNKLIIQSICLCLLSCFGAFHAFSQQEHNIWYFGQNTGLDFTNGSPTVLTNGSINTVEACASYCTPSGDLLFYTDGITVWNKNHDVMPNGNGLIGNTSTTQTLIIPLPNSSDQFYVFSMPKTSSGTVQAYYSEVNMTLDGGSGNVTSIKNVPFMSESTEKVTAIKHANGTDFWILAHKKNSGIYVTYLLTQAGLSTTAIESDVGVVLTSTHLGNYTGYLKANLSGTVVASAHGFMGTEVLNFDKSTGQFTLWFHLSESHYGVEFSPSERFLYASRGGSHYMHQYDLEAGTTADIENSKIEFGDQSTWVGYHVSALQIAPDGKIYVGKQGGDYINVIHNPDELGAFCNYEEEAIYLDGKMAMLGLPPAVPVSINQPPVDPPVVPPLTPITLEPPNTSTSNLVMPNVFTPDGDLINDFFVPVNSEAFVSAETIILNRWGQEVFSGDILQAGWNGKASNDTQCKAGIYFWEVIAVDDLGETLKLNGFVHLIRNDGE